MNKLTGDRRSRKATKPDSRLVAGRRLMENDMNLELEDVCETVLSSRFNVTIIYESLPDGMRAKRFTDQLSAGKGELNLNIWNFLVLGISEIRNVAASAAAAADVVIFSLSGAKEFPPQVREWMEMWSWLIDRMHPMVVAIFAAPAAGVVPIRACLRSVAMRKGLNFYAAVPRE